jgi:hypothetical protein
LVEEAEGVVAVVDNSKSFEDFSFVEREERNEGWRWCCGLGLERARIEERGE